MRFEGASGPRHSRRNENEPMTSPREKRICSPPASGFGRMLMIERSELRPWKPTPATRFFHVSRDFRSLRGCQILVCGQLLLHLAAFWRVESLLDFFAWSKRCARVVRRARASAQVRRGDKQGENERASHWSGSLGEAPLESPVPHSITSSARAERPGGTSMPNDLAVAKLITKSNLVDCTTGRSDGLAPFQMRPA